MCKLIYDLVYLRKCVKDHEETLNPDLNWWNKLFTPLIKFKKFETIFPEKQPVNASAVLEFIAENKGYLKQKSAGNDVEFVKSGKNETEIYMTKKLEELKDLDAFVTKFDDSGAPGKFLKIFGVEIVYAIVLNQ